MNPINPDEQARLKAEYEALRAQLNEFEPAMDAADLDDMIIDALSAFKICSTDIAAKVGQTHAEAVMERTSYDSKIRALKALLA